MAITEHPFSCDACGKNRQHDVNHWWILLKYGFDREDTTNGLVIVPWNTEEALMPGRTHACGIACAILLTARYLTSGEFAPLHGGAHGKKEGEGKEKVISIEEAQAVHQAAAGSAAIPGGTTGRATVPDGASGNDSR